MQGIGIHESSKFAHMQHIQRQNFHYLVSLVALGCFGQARVTDPILEPGTRTCNMFLEVFDWFWDWINTLAITMTPCIGCMHAALLNKSLRYRSREPDKSCRVTWDPIWFSGDGKVGALKCPSAMSILCHMRALCLRPATQNCKANPCHCMLLLNKSK